MFSQYFGHYLLNCGLITREQLADALEYQQSVHVKFGVITIDEGFMTPSQVEEVHEKQKQVDKRFGEIAVELGYLSNDQVESLISVQKQGHLFLAQSLVDRGYMNIEQFGQALDEYKRDNSLSDDQFEAIKSGNVETLVNSILSKEKDTYSEYLSLFAKNMIRFIDDQMYLEVAEQENTQQQNWLVHQEIVGNDPLFTAITANKNVFLYLASKYAEEELTEIDELAQASVSEFLNLHNGIYLVNKSNKGVELNMKPQKLKEKAAVSGNTFVVTVQTTKGPFQLILSNQPEQVSIS
ncbi:hypothetical protein [Bacillus sp. JJ1764]|uniref:hypothetical protein n=1 Tax=Bacillus sp. JJ1764 TaxID=3122964 RepID=UPI0030001436